MSRTSSITLWYQNIHWLPLKRTFLAVVSDAQSLLVSVLLLVLLYNCQYKSYICPTQHIHSLCHSKVYTLLVGLLHIKQLTVYTAQVETLKLTDGDRSQQEEGRLYWWEKNRLSVCISGTCSWWCYLQYGLLNVLAQSLWHAAHIVRHLGHALSQAVWQGLHSVGHVPHGAPQRIYKCVYLMGP